MPLSIRSRLLLLLLSVLLPAMLGVGWLVANTFESERAVNERNLRQVSHGLAMAVQIEVGRRTTIAHLLAGSRWLEAPEGTSAEDLANFRQQALSAMADVEGWVELRNPQGLLLDTRQPPDPDLQSASAPEPLSNGRAARAFRPADDRGSGGRYASLVEPVRRDGEVFYNVAVTLPAAVLQRLLDSQPAVPGSTTAIVDPAGAFLARQLDGRAFAAPRLSAHQLAVFEARREGLFETASPDDEPITGYFSTGPLGLRFVSAMPSAALFAPWPSAVLRIVVAAAAVLLLALAGGLWLSSRITRPLGALKDAARRLQQGQPLSFSSTGIVEFDEVATAMVQAGGAIGAARHELESQVGAAVARTRSAEQVNAHSQRVEALGRLTGGVAHDFNNLLGIISNSMHLLQRHPAVAELQSPIDAALRAVEVGSQLTQHLLRFAGRRPTHAQRVHPALALPEMRELIGSVLGARIALSIQVADNTHPVLIDPGELELALLNLALNARDAMPSGGSLQLRARNARTDEFEGLPLLPGGYLLISLSDDGVGIAPPLLTHVFEPFFTTKAVGKGTGLGLSQVLGFCLQAGGTARIDSTPGLGTTVTLLLPAAAAPPQESTPVQRTDRTAATQPAAADHGPEVDALAGARVLLVEDNEGLAAMTAALLRANGAVVAHAPDADAALRAIEHEVRFDAVLSDVVMPGSLGGLDLARRLRRQHPDLPVLLISGYNDAAVEAAKEFVLLRKPGPPEEMVLALSAAIWPRPAHLAGPMALPEPATTAISTR